MLLLIIALIVVLALFGAGFALHVLWWVAIAALVIALIGFFHLGIRDVMQHLFDLLLRIRFEPQQLIL